MRSLPAAHVRTRTHLDCRSVSKNLTPNAPTVTSLQEEVAARRKSSGESTSCVQRSRNCISCVPSVLLHVYQLRPELSTPNMTSCVPRLVRNCISCIERYGCTQQLEGSYSFIKASAHRTRPSAAARPLSRAASPRGLVRAYR